MKREHEQCKNYYLFYFEFAGTCLHTLNMKTSETFIFKLYYSRFVVDAAFHQQLIFVSGGKENDEKYFLNSCAILDLETMTIDKSNALSEKKSHVSLIST